MRYKRLTMSAIVALQTGATLTGRALAVTHVSLTQATVTPPLPSCVNWSP